MMIQIKVKVDVENLRARLSQQTGGMPLGPADVAAWLSEHRFRSSAPRPADDWIVDDEALEALRPWEVLQRLPLCVVEGGEAAGVQMHA